MAAHQKEIRVEARLRNNILYHLIFDNYKSVAEFCRAHKTTQMAAIGELLNLKTSPLALDKEGEVIGYRTLPKRLAKIFKRLPEDIFPANIYKLPKTEAAIEIGFDAIAMNREELLIENMGFKNIDNMQVKRDIEESMSDIPLRSREILKARMDGDTLEVVAKKHKTTRENVRQIEQKTLRLLRHPSRAKLTRENQFWKIRSKTDKAEELSDETLISIIEGRKK
jgi:hypothetical protein